MGQRRDTAALMVVGKNMCDRIVSPCEHGYLCNMENGPGCTIVMPDLILHYMKLLQHIKIKRGLKYSFSGYFNLFAIVATVPVQLQCVFSTL